MSPSADSPKDRIILGLMTIGPSAADGARISDMKVFQEVLDLFQSRGYHEVDTARSYIACKQEAYMREAGWKARKLTMGTKVVYPFSPGENSAEGVIQSVETSLKELDTDSVDVRD